MYSSSLLHIGLITTLGTSIRAIAIEPTFSGPESVHYNLPRQADGVEPIKLAPVKNPNKKSNGFAKVLDVELKDEEHVFFNSDGVYAEATVFVSGDKQKIISVDRMDDELRSLGCPSDKELIIELGTQAGYEKAKSSWSWVTNGDNTFVFIADGECGGEDGLQPYIINDITFDDGAHKATLKGQVQDWDEWVTDVVLHASTNPFDGFSDLTQKRGIFDIDKSGDVSFATDFSGKEIFGVDIGENNNTRVGLTCADCGITGGVHYDLQFDSRHPLDGIKGSITAMNGLGARFGLGLELAGSLTAPKDWKVDILPPTPIPGVSFSILSIATVGFETAVAAQASLTSVEGELKAMFGVAMTIPDQTTFRLGENSDNISPNFAQIGPEFSASISVSAQLNPTVTLGIVATLANVGAVAGVALQAPRLTATLDAELTTQGICKNDAIASIGLKVDVDAGISVFGGRGSLTDLPNAKEIYRLPAYSIFDECFPIGDGAPDSNPTPQPGNDCPYSKLGQAVGDVKYEDGSFGRYCNVAYPGGVSVILPGPNDSNIWEVGVDANSSGVQNFCTFYKKMFSNNDYTKYWCEEPIIDVPKGSVYTMPDNTRQRNICVICS